jgi:hypothetical protein
VLTKIVSRPSVLAAAAVALSPGGHVLLSALVERRRVTLRDDYPAVLFGDPALALAAALAGRALGPRVAASPLLSAGPLAALTGGAVLFGAWQARDEVRRGVYSREQALSPSKLWHQFVVYPGLSTLVLAPLAPATRRLLRGSAGRGERRDTVAAWAGVALWAALTLEGVRRPRTGHTAYVWRRPGRARRSAARRRPGPQLGDRLQEQRVAVVHEPLHGGALVG